VDLALSLGAGLKYEIREPVLKLAGGSSKRDQSVISNTREQWALAALQVAVLRLTIPVSAR
jgi:hypothetical protein